MLVSSLHIEIHIVMQIGRASVICVYECFDYLVIFGELHKFSENRKINAIVMTQCTHLYTHTYVCTYFFKNTFIIIVFMRTYDFIRSKYVRVAIRF